METLAYSEKANKGRGGWTTFYSWHPDWMVKLNNRLFSFKDGQLWLHHDESNPERNNFYGEQYGSSITTIFNDGNAEDKIFKTIVVESNKRWSVDMFTNYAEGQITPNEFNQRESRFFAYIRKNEDINDLRGHTAQGIGTITGHSGVNVTFSMMPNLVDIGDVLYQMNGADQEEIGTISGIAGNTISVAVINIPPVTGYFCFAMKNARVEGAEMRGHYLEVKLENTDTDAVELLAVNTNAVKSFV